MIGVYYAMLGGRPGGTLAPPKFQRFLLHCIGLNFLEIVSGTPIDRLHP